MSSMSRREWLQTTAAAAAAAGLSAGAAQTRADKPNIIVVLADDLGYGELGCYGQTRIHTPNLDVLAREGIRFTQCYAGSTVCAPSRCSLMTGLHTGHCWIRGNARVPLRPEDVTVAELLQEAGYNTALIGKWGLGNEDTTGTPNRQGFDYFFGYLDQGHAHNYYPSFLWRNDARVPLKNVEDPKHRGVAAEAVEYSHDLFTQDALRYVDEHASKPFFLYLAYTLPHANNEAGNARGDGMEVPDYGPYSGENWPNPEKGRAAMITRLDRDVGALIQKLRDLGIDKNTIVLFSSDNGPHKEGGSDPAFFGSSGPLRGYKRALYDGGIRVPTIAWWPGVVAPGVSDHVWAFWDFLATACELAGVSPPSTTDGISIVPTLRPHDGVRQKHHEFLYWEFQEKEPKQAVRMGHWKAVRTVGQPIELYDLATDIGEQRNVAAERSDIVSRIEDYLKTARTDNPHWTLKA